MLIDGVSLWLAGTNCYVVAPEAGGPAIVVDCPPDLDGIEALLRKHNLTPVAALVTHGHVDHTGGSGTFSRATGVTAYLHPDDLFLAMAPGEQLAAIFGGHPAVGSEFVPPDRFEDLADGDVLQLAGLGVEVLHTPGHTPGHCCFRLGDVLFSGDQLFAGSIGRTDLPGGDFGTLMDSMEKKILTLDDDTRVLPGHGPATTVGRERASNPFLAQFGA